MTGAKYSCSTFSRHRIPLWQRFHLSLICIALLLGSQSHAGVDEPAGYRMELYDDLVPAGLAGAMTVSALEVQRLQHEQDAVVIDVIPEHRRPEFLPEDQIWIPVPHKGVPDALWLPDTGFGVLSEVAENYFKLHLEQAVRGDFSHPVVFYCRSDCWMSWNAAKRALTYGYSKVYWFADGIDDWFFEGFDFALLTPAEGERQ